MELQILVVLRSATTMCGAQSVMTCGVLLMHKWPVDNWDLVQLVSMYYNYYKLLLMKEVSPGWVRTLKILQSVQWFD